MEMRLQRTSSGVTRHLHLHTHTHTIPPHPGTEDSPPQGEQGAVGAGQIGKQRLQVPDLLTHLHSYREHKLLEETGAHLLITYCKLRVRLVPSSLLQSWGGKSGLTLRPGQGASPREESQSPRA